MNPKESTVKNMPTDQADGLRQLMSHGAGQMLAVVGSGPAVGATSVAVNLAAALAQQGKDVLLFDERRGRPLQTGQRKGRLLVIDTVLDLQGALSPLAAQADHVLVVLQPNAASIKACYSCIKKLHYAHALQRVRVLVNRASDKAQAQHILANLAHTSGRYLSLTLQSAGAVRADARLSDARRLNLSVVEAFQTSPATIDFHQIASDLLQWTWRPLDDGKASAQATARPTREAKPALQMH